ncbi:hypothetical protein RRG08_034937 [Elysia crispata]|uniref:Uncharacterized protein n=1 Tax=Elysia crispata TaxID=231223 RepID=A0AAE1CR71_9GAST|nr:hypothetical protein RRG08_034937 [Elysia crispata]
MHCPARQHGLRQAEQSELSPPVIRKSRASGKAPWFMTYLHGFEVNLSLIIDCVVLAGMIGPWRSNLSKCHGSPDWRLSDAPGRSGGNDDDLKASAILPPSAFGRRFHKAVAPAVTGRTDQPSVLLCRVVVGCSTVWRNGSEATSSSPCQTLPRATLVTAIPSFRCLPPAGPSLKDNIRWLLAIGRFLKTKGCGRDLQGLPMDTAVSL